jgi:hypothetical protein
MWAAWHAVTETANPWLDTLTTEALQEYFLVDGKPWREDIGTFIRRTTYHYWYHIGNRRRSGSCSGTPIFPSSSAIFRRAAPTGPNSG